MPCLAPAGTECLPTFWGIIPPIARCTMPGRREFLLGAAAGAAGWLRAAEDEKVIPFVGTPAFNPARPNMIWDDLTQWNTPTDQVFAVQHYGVPEFDAAS